jgi:hypothetical protein
MIPAFCSCRSTLARLARRAASGVLAILPLAAPSAAPLYWDGGDGSWGTLSAWSSDATAATPDPGSVPGSGDTVSFNRAGNNAVADQVITLDGARTVQGLTFSNSGNTTINAGSGGSLTGNNSGNASITLIAGSGNVTIAPDVTFGTSGSGGNYTLDSAGSRLVFNAMVTSPRTGARTWQILGTSGGVVEFADGLRLNSAPGNTNSRENTITGNGTLIIGGNISRGGASDSRLGTGPTFSGTLRLNNSSNNQTSFMNHAGGTLQLGHDSALPESGLNWIGGTIEAVGGPRNIAQAVVGGATGTGNTSSNATLTIGGSEAITFTNSSFTLSNVSGGAPTADRRLVVTNTASTSIAGDFLNLNPNLSTTNTIEFEIGALSHLLISSSLRGRSGTVSIASSDIIKSGEGILELTANNTYNRIYSAGGVESVGTRTTTVTAGTLLANNGSNGSATSTTELSVSANARLGGNGTIGNATRGNATLADDAILAPGRKLTGTAADRIGNLTFTRNLTLGDFVYEWDVLSGSSHDTFNAGNITLANNASTTLQLRALDNAFNPNGVSFVIGTWTGTGSLGSGDLDLSWTLNGTSAAGWDLSAAKVTYLGTTQQLVLSGATLVPEPSVVLLAAGAFAALSLRRVRRPTNSVQRP